MKKIGWIGTGVMGNSMCKHILSSNKYELQVFSRTKQKTENLVELGAIYRTPSEIAQDVDYLVLMLGYPSDLEQVLYKDKVLEYLKEGTILIDHTTSDPSLARQIYKDCQTLKIRSLDCPVTGGDVGARNGTLTIFVGGDQQVY